MFPVSVKPSRHQLAQILPKWSPVD